MRHDDLSKRRIYAFASVLLFAIATLIAELGKQLMTADIVAGGYAMWAVAGAVGVLGWLAFDQWRHYHRIIRNIRRDG